MNFEREKLFKFLLDNNYIDVDINGTVTNLKKNKIIKSFNCGDYYRINYKYNDKYNGIQLHRLVWIKFNGLIEENNDNRVWINHIDGDKLNNNLKLNPFSNKYIE